MDREYESMADDQDEALDDFKRGLHRTKDTFDRAADIHRRIDDGKPDPQTKDAGQTLQKGKSGNVSENSANVKGIPGGLKGGINNTGNAVSAEGKDIAKEVGKYASKGVDSGAAKGAAAAATGPVGAAALAAEKTIEAVAGHVKKIGEQTAEAAEKKSTKAAKESVQASYKKSSSADDNIAIRTLIFLMGVILAFITIIFVLFMWITTMLLAPVTNLFHALRYGWDSAGEAIEYLSKDASYDEIATFEIMSLKDAFERAFYEVSFDEVSQVLEEHPDWDEDLTYESYASNEFPYILDGSACNVNYLEILTVMQMNPDFDWRHFHYDNYKALFEDREFLRCFYDMKITEEEKDIYNDNNEYVKTITYGKVSIGRYPLMKFFDYFDVDPHADNITIPALNNYQALEMISSYTTSIAPVTFFGTSQRSNLKAYTNPTDELYVDKENTYADQLSRMEEVGEIDVSNGVPLYAQADSRWGEERYGSKNLAKTGCCVTSMSMVISYFSKQTITPGVLIKKMRAEYKGDLVRSDLSKDYGFNQYDTEVPFSAQHAAGQLDIGRLLIVHIKNGHLGHSKDYGHYVVMTGCRINGEEQIFMINDPAGGKALEFTAEECAAHIDREWSYGL